MELSLPQAAALSGRSERQLRYAIQQKRLAARKVDGHWVIRQQDLQLSPGQAQAAVARRERLQEVVEQSLGLSGESSARGRSYSVVDLRAFQQGQALYSQLGAVLPEGHGLLAILRGVLVLVTQGCHCYHSRDKAEAFGAARQRACELLTGLLLLPEEAPARAVASRVEQELIRSLAGLIRRAERGRR